MKRQFFAIASTAVSVITAWSFAAPAQAFPEQEPNDRYRPMQIYLSNTTNVTSVQGTVRRQHDEDVFLFEVKKPSDLLITLTNLRENTDANLWVYKDNGDRRLAGGDSQIGFSFNRGNADERVSLQNVQPGWYLILVESNSDTLTMPTYSLNIKPTPKS